jgi:hypothetical protein
MRRYWLLGWVAAFGACAKAESKLEEGASLPAFSLADVAGTWNMEAVRDSGGGVLATYQIGGTADPSTWTITFPNRSPIPLRVTIDGDSLITDAGPYESVLRAGVVVSTRAVSWLRDGKLTGKFVAKYATRMVDSVLTGRTEGIRAQ